MDSETLKKVGLTSEQLSKQVVDQCRVVEHLATELAKLFKDLGVIASKDHDMSEMIGRRSCDMMEVIGEAMNGLDATQPEDKWVNPIFAEAHRLKQQLWND